MSLRTEPGSSLRLPKSAVRWIFTGLLVSSALVVLISILSGISISDFVTIGYVPFALSAAASATGLLVGVLRFRTVARALANNPKLGLGGLGNVKLASHFLTLTTPSTVGGLVLSTAWLTRRGITRGDAMWISYFEMLIQIYVSSALLLVAALYAFSRGAMMIGSTLTFLSLLLAIGYSVVFLIPALKGRLVPHRIFELLAFFVGTERATRMEGAAQQDAQRFCVAARMMLSRGQLSLVAKSVCLTIVEAILSGLALWFIVVSAGLKIDPFSSTLVAYSAIAIGAVPVSVGGSGITELAMKYYLSSVYGFSSWAAIILWRVASYQVLLAICGVAFVFLMRRAMKSVSEAPQHSARVSTSGS